MSPSKPRGLHGQRGTSAVETSLVMVFVLALLFGIIDCGRAMYTYHFVSNLARQTTRYAMVRGSACVLAGCPATASQIQTYAQSIAGPLIDTAALTVTTTWTSSTGCAGAPYQGPGCSVAVQIRYPFHFDLPLLPATAMSMVGSSQMIISQ